MGKPQMLDDSVSEDIADDPTTGTKLDISVQETGTVQDNAAVRAVALLAVWASRRVQRRLEERGLELSDAVTGVKTKGYGGKNAKN